MIELKNVSKAYKNEQVLDNFNLTVESTDFIAIMGKSGKGKTTILNILAGLQKIDSGHYFLDDVEVNKLSTEKRQNYARIKSGTSFKIMHY